MSPESKNNPFRNEQKRLDYRKQFLWLRARMIQAIRRFFTEKDYLEVETPQLIPAPPPEIHIDAISTDAGYLHTSPELCMKRLLASGFPKIFQISKCFRAGERGDLHLSEFCLLEWYRVGIDYHDLMEECRELTLWISDELGLAEKISYQGIKIDLRRPWKKISVEAAFADYASMTLDQALEKGCFDEVMVQEVEPHLLSMGPVILYDYPVSLAALARLKPDNPELADGAICEQKDVYLQIVDQKIFCIAHLFGSEEGLIIGLHIHKAVFIFLAVKKLHPAFFQVCRLKGIS